MRAWGETFKSEIPELAPLLTSEQGKSMGVSQYEVCMFVRVWMPLYSLCLSSSTTAFAGSKVCARAPRRA